MQHGHVVLRSSRGDVLTVAVEAVYENGVLRLEQPVDLKEHAKVRVIIEDGEQARSAMEDDDPTGWKTARELIGCITEDLVAENVAENHDRYIYRRDP
jgi:predicted DNA-binding antitoxin AbrB/MazE fold protein